MSRAIKSSISFTFEYEAYAKDDPGFVECTIHYNYLPGTPETGRYSGPPENYDPGSAHEVDYLRAEREVERDGKKVWLPIADDEFLGEQCQRYLASRDEDDLAEGSGPDPDLAYEDMLERRRMDRDA